MELLSPAGSFKALIGAINAGCDAVYLGGEKFGARAYAENFSDEEIIKSIRICHIYDVKVYLTVNTMIKESEFSEVCEYIEKFEEAGLDGCIVQDIGLISVFTKRFPNLECHISTQGFATGIESVRFYKNLGAKRVVLARELSLEEIKHIKENIDIEIETFIHGAMCYSYSGECLFSSCLGGRSGNRGRCAGPCRLSYDYIGIENATKDSYFLSMKDQCTLEILPKLIEAGIDSLKIEGRMKKPEYSAYVTSIYRKYIDLYHKNPKNYKVDTRDIEKLRHIYLRAEIGTGYYDCQNGKEMLTLDFPGYLGSDDALLKEISDKYLNGLKRKPVTAFLSCITGNELSLTYSYDVYSATATGSIVQKAMNRPVSKEDLEKKISKLGDTCFSIEDLFVEMSEDSFVAVKELNDLRRNAIEQLENEILGTRKQLETQDLLTVKRNKHILDKPVITLYSREQANAAKDFIQYAYIGIPCELSNSFSDILEGNLLVLPDVIRIKDYDYLKEKLSIACNRNMAGVIVRNYEALSFLFEISYDGIIIAGSELYAANSASVKFFDKIFDAYVLPLELSKEEIRDIKSDSAFLLSYGKIPLMHTANCTRKSNYKCTPHKGEPFSYIKDRKNMVFPVYRNCDCCSNIIFNSVPTCLYDKHVSKEWDINKTIIALTDEDYDESINILSLYFKGQGNVPKNHTKFYWKQGVL